MTFLQTFTQAYLIMLIIALVISSAGFIKYVYFISLGYGFSVAALGIANLIIFRDVLTLPTTILSALLIVYGCRLGFFLLIREIKSAAYRDTMKKETKDGSKVSFFAKVCIWIPCALLYVFQVSPIFFRLQNAKVVFDLLHVMPDVENPSVNFFSSDKCSIAGIIILVLGIAIESIADLQKSAAKKKNAKRFCDSGLYKIVRCPNYFGEILIWTGVFVSGCSILSGVWQWVTSIIGYASIVWIMFGGARRLEIRQNKNYGNDPEYQEYVKKTPIIIPLIPLYTVEKYKFLIG